MSPLPRKTKTGRTAPGQSRSQKRLWSIPEHREKMIAARRRWQPLWDANPDRYSRRGIPNGWRKEDAMKAWAAAGEQADIALRGFEAAGLVPAVAIPESDDELAKLCLREACKIALGPVDNRRKLIATNMVLRFTKPQPPRRHATVAITPEEWLRSAIVAGAATS
jgi:hypothetical protein